jgi:hypothetical protein
MLTLDAQGIVVLMRDYLMSTRKRSTNDEREGKEMKYHETF